MGVLSRRGFLGTETVKQKGQEKLQELKQRWHVISLFHFTEDQFIIEGKDKR